MLAHKTNVHSLKGITRELENVVFTEADVKWVHNPHTDALVITVSIANSIVHRILVDNGSTANIFFRDAYQRPG